MFNTYVNKRTEYVPYEKSVTVVEKRAPTDESIKIYEEIKEKAYSSIVNSFQSIDNEVNFNCVVYRDILSYSNYILYSLTINGRKIENKVRIKEEFSTDRYEITKRIYEDLAKQLSEDLLKMVVMEV